MGVEGAKALAEALKLNKNLKNLNLGIFLLLFTYCYSVSRIKLDILNFKK